MAEEEEEEEEKERRGREGEIENKGKDILERRD